MVADRIMKMNTSVTVALYDKIYEMRASGIDIAPFNAGEPDFDSPKEVIDQCIAALTTGKTHYAKTAGIEPLRKAIAEKLLKDNYAKYDSSQIVVTVGAKQALFNAVMALCNPGDEVILPIPCWVSYLEMIKLAGGVPVYVKTNTDYSLNIDAIREAVTAKTKMIIINTPNNPTGNVYSRKELEELGALAVEKNFYVLSDEVYEKLVYDGTNMVSIASLSDEIWEHTVTVNGFSKGFAMTGWRLGYSAAPTEITKAMIKLQGHITFHNTTFAQYGAVEALKSCDDYVVEMVKTFDERRKIMYEMLCEIPGVKCEKPKGAFYMFPDIHFYFGKGYHGRIIRNSVDLCDYLLEEARVAVVPGDAFESPETIRISYSTSTDCIIAGMNRLKEALIKLE